MRFTSLSILLGVLLPSWAFAQLTVQNVTYNSGQTVTLTSPTTIVAGPSVTVSSGATVSYRAGVSVKLLPGFTASSGSNFSIAVGDEVRDNGDDNNNGIPNWWEMLYFGSNTGADANADPDNDGYTNLMEFNLGLNPLEPNVGGGGLGNTPGFWPNGGDESTPVGATAGELSVDKSGAATYTIPIWVTPGTSGMQPQLSLNYSSKAGSGMAGFGWSLGGVSAITRGPTTKAVDNTVYGVVFQEFDKFYMDGQRLILVSGQQGQGDSRYRTELESFSDVKAVGSTGSNQGPASFEVRTKAGLKIEFGSNPDSRLVKNGTSQVLTWAVSKITDSSGNYMSYSYHNDTVTGEMRLSRIDYTGNAPAGLATYASVQFDYEERSDVLIGYISGASTKQAHRIKYIKSYYGSTVSRTYTLNYTTRAENGRSILESITETGSDGKSYPNLTFQYSNPEAGWLMLDSAWEPPVLMADVDDNDKPRQGTGFIDLNGDGRPDFVKNRKVNATTFERETWINTPSGWANTPSYRVPASAILDYGNTQSATRFTDLNGDGLVDVVTYEEVGGGFQYVAYINNGSGFVSAPRYTFPNVHIADIELLLWSYATPPAGWSGYDTAGVMLHNVEYFDADGDGRVDAICHFEIGYNNLEYNNTTLVNAAVILRNNGEGNDAQLGSAWTLLPAASTFAIPGAIGSRYVDLDGDGLPDYLRRFTEVEGGNISHAIKNTNGVYGFSLSGHLSPVTLSHNYNPSGAELIDLNGDGLVDLVRNNEGGETASQAYLNTGVGWVFSSGHIPPFVLTKNYVPSGAAFIDINNDGLLDSVLSREGTAKSTFLGNGLGWTAASSQYDLPVRLAESAATDYKGGGVDFVDLNGDGAVDVVWHYRRNGIVIKGAALNKRINPDRLIKVTNGMGVQVGISYQSLADNPDPNKLFYKRGTVALPGVANVAGAIQAVSAVTHEDGAGGYYTVSYQYSGLRFDRLRGSLGFESMTVTDKKKRIQYYTEFEQEFPYTGMPAYKRTRYIGEDGSLEVNLSVTATDYDKKPLNSNSTFFVFAKETTVTTRDLDNSMISTVTTEIPIPDQNIDVYGNILKIEVDSGDGYKKITTSTYAEPDLTNWRLHRLISASVQSIAPGHSITRASEFIYNDRGLLLSETIEPQSVQNKLTTTYGYDNYGNRNSTTISGAGISIDSNDAIVTSEALSRLTLKTYDSKGRFPTIVTSVLGDNNSLNTSYTYDDSLGMAKSVTDPNALITSWTHDGFGRIKTETRPDATVTQTHYRWSASPVYGKYLVETLISGSAPSLVFYDRFGRPFANASVSGDGRIVYQAAYFDDRGRVAQSSVPYFSGDVSYGTKTTYDDLDRPVKIETNDEEATATGGKVSQYFSYNGLITTATDAKERVTITTKNSQGWTVMVKRNATGVDSTPASQVTYAYDPLGNLTATMADGAITEIGYDQRGRKVSMLDDDMGEWQYRYNIFGELIWQKDAEGNRTKMGYDAIGRLVSRLEPEGLTTWAYDTAPRVGGGVWRGILHTVTVSSPTNYSETFTYGDYGRLTEIVRNIDGVPYLVKQEYDGAGRPTVATYPGNFKTRNVYNNYGFLKEVRGSGMVNNNVVYWMAQSYTSTGQIDSEYYSNGIANDRTYSPRTGRLMSATVGLASETTPPWSVQSLQYSYDVMGNVKTRVDSTTSRNESFTYDGLDRLRSSTLNGNSVVVTYRVNGNIDTKSDVGTYSYATGSVLPHAVIGVSGVTGGSITSAQSYTYDNNGRMISGGGRSYSWTSFNQVKSITRDGVSTNFYFGAGHERVRQVGPISTTVYVGTNFERVITGGVFKNKYYIMGPTGRIGVHITDADNNHVELSYFHTDGLGSITAVSGVSGSIVQRFAFDSWGKRTDSIGGEVNPDVARKYSRGYTDHEQLDALALVHMNGRIYDPIIGRFLSADSFVDGILDPQGYNRFSYVGNNPLGAFDPSGHTSFRNAFKAILPAIAGAISAGTLGPVVGGWINSTFTITSTAGTAASAAVGAGIAGGAASGFTGSLVNGGSVGDAFKSAAIGGFVGGASAYLGNRMMGALPKEWNLSRFGRIPGAFQRGAFVGAARGALQTGFYGGKLLGNIGKDALYTSASSGMTAIGDELLTNYQEITGGFNEATAAKVRQFIAENPDHPKVVALQSMPEGLTEITINALTDVQKYYAGVAAVNSISPLGALVGAGAGAGVGYLIGGSDGAMTGAIAGGLYGYFSSGWNVNFRFDPTTEVLQVDAQVRFLGFSVPGASGYVTAHFNGFDAKEVFRTTYGVGVGPVFPKFAEYNFNQLDLPEWVGGGVFLFSLYKNGAFK